MDLGPTLQQPRVKLMLLGKASPLFSSTHPMAVAFWAQAVSCHRVCHSSGDLPSHFGGLCHAAGVQQKAGNNVGTQAGTFIPAPMSHWKAFFGSLTSFPKSLPHSKGKANTMPVSSREISYIFPAAPDQGAKPV